MRRILWLIVTVFLFSCEKEQILEERRKEMPYNNGKIVAPIDTSDVRLALGISSNDVGTLCSYTGINPFAKYKPTRYEYLETHDDQYLATSGNCGINIPLTSYQSTPPNWVHELPRGWDPWIEPYRLTDFDGYNNRATPFLSTYIPDKLGRNGTVSLHKELSRYPGRSDMVNIEDMHVTVDGDQTFPLADMYFAVVVWGNGRTYFRTSDNKIGHNTITDDIITLDMLEYDQTYRITTCLSLEKKGESDLPPGKLWSLSYDFGNNIKSVSQKTITVTGAATGPRILGIQFLNPRSQGDSFFFADGLICTFDKPGDGSTFRYSSIRFEGSIIEDNGWINLPGFSGTLPSGSKTANANFAIEIPTSRQDDYVIFKIYSQSSASAPEYLELEGQIFIENKE